VVFQLAVVIVIPIILGISVVPPFDLPEEPVEVSVPDEPLSDLPDRDFLYFFLMLIWLFFLIRILFQIRKGTFTLQRKY
jgi:hypothetical protein